MQDIHIVVMMLTVLSMQDILQWLHREEFPDDNVKLQSGDLTYKEQGHKTIRVNLENANLHF